MAFVKENVPPQDIEKYGLRDINQQFLKLDESYIWTVDRERDVYLRDMGWNWQEPSQIKMSFYWKGHLLQLLLDADNKPIAPGKSQTTWSVGPKRSAHLPLPAELEPLRAEVVADLKEALAAYHGIDLQSASQEEKPLFLF